LWSVQVTWDAQKNFIENGIVTNVAADEPNVNEVLLPAVYGFNAWGADAKDTRG
jgi:hypothetical protein